jgi:hypothetical protein
VDSKGVFTETMDQATFYLFKNYGLNGILTALQVASEFALLIEMGESDYYTVDWLRQSL